MKKARAIAPEMASNYVAHTLLGDPVGEAMAQDFTELGAEESRRLIEAAMNEEGGEALRNAPASLREFFREAETPPEWLDYAAFSPAVRMFYRNSQIILAAFVAGVLIEGFTTNIAKSFFITGRVRDQGVRRLGQNNRSHDGDIPPRRPVQVWRRLETLGPDQDSSCASEASPKQFRRMGCRSLGGAD